MHMVFIGVNQPYLGGSGPLFDAKFRVSAFSGLECWTGVLDWSTGVESLEWSTAWSAYI